MTDEEEYIAPWEKAFKRVLTPIEEFIHRQTTSGILLMLCAIGASLLGGIGFTVSIFITELGFVHSPEDLLMAKTGILIASVIASVAGYLWLYIYSCNPIYND